MHACSVVCVKLISYNSDTVVYCEELKLATINEQYENNMILLFRISKVKISRSNFVRRALVTAQSEVFPRRGNSSIP